MTTMKKKILLATALLAVSGAVIAQELTTKNDNNMNTDTKEIYFAGGCFWGTEHFMKQIRGSVRMESEIRSYFMESRLRQQPCDKSDL